MLFSTNRWELTIIFRHVSHNPLVLQGRHMCCSYICSGGYKARYSDILVPIHVGFEISFYLPLDWLTPQCKRTSSVMLLVPSWSKIGSWFFQLKANEVFISLAWSEKNWINWTRYAEFTFRADNRHSISTPKSELCKLLKCCFLWKYEWQQMYDRYWLLSLFQLWSTHKGNLNFRSLPSNEYTAAIALFFFVQKCMSPTTKKLRYNENIPRDLEVE